MTKANSSRSSSVMYRKTHAHFLRNPQRKGEIIPFPEVFLVLSRLRPSKDEMFEFLEEMQKEGLIEIVKYHGIKINSERDEK